MDADTWYVLRVSPRDETLLRCTPTSHERVDLPGTARPRNPAMDQSLTAERVETASPYAPEGARRHLDDAEPRGTHVVDDPAFEKDERERHFRELGQTLREMRREHEGPVVLAMDPARAAMFEAVGGVPVRAILPDVPASTPENLWRTSHAALEASA